MTSVECAECRTLVTVDADTIPRQGRGVTCPGCGVTTIVKPFRGNSVRRRRVGGCFVPDFVLFDRSLRPGDRLVFCALDFYAHGADECDPKRADIAEQADCSDRFLDGAFRRLEAIGAIRRRPQFDEEGNQISNLYELAGTTPLDPVEVPRVLPFQGKADS